MAVQEGISMRQWHQVFTHICPSTCVQDSQKGAGVAVSQMEQLKHTTFLSLEPSHHLQVCSKDVWCARSSSTGLHLEACAAPSPDYRKTLQQRARVQLYSNTVERGSPVAVMGAAKTSPSHGDHMWNKGIIYLTYYICYLHIHLANYKKLYNAFVTCSHTTDTKEKIHMRTSRSNWKYCMWICNSST